MNKFDEIFLDLVSTKMFYHLLNHIEIPEFYLLHKSVLEKKSSLSSIKRKAILVKGQLIQNRLDELKSVGNGKNS